jgi:uncharacterized protein YecE (DUF72 family)
MAARAYVGTSGWNYKHWADGVFYPKGLKQSEWLAYFTRYFDTVEINNTFYHLPARKVFEEWYDSTPDDFTFAVKASRFITHMKKLANPEEHAALFLQNASGLREKLGVVLWQLPPYWKFNKERLEDLFEFISGQDIVTGLRSALEVRHESWNSEECFEVLRRYNVSLALADWPGLSLDGPVTADFVFLRRHGPGSLYASDYPDSYLKRDAMRIVEWLAEGKDVYIYFNNDAFGYAVKNALRLKELLGQEESNAEK